jgi:hypothetical protein
MSKWNEYTTEDLDCILSDYSKDVNGFRDRTVSYNDREALITKLESLDLYMESMKSTKEGRNRLREEGWVISEFEVEDGWDRAAYDARYNSDPNDIF